MSSTDWLTDFTGIIALLTLFQVLTFLSQRRVTIFAERAQLVLNPKDPAVTGFAVGEHPRLAVEVINIGKTAAYGLMAKAWMDIVRPPFLDFSGTANAVTDLETKTVYPGNQPLRLNFKIETDHPLSQRDFDDWNRGQNQLWIRIRIEYRDLFHKRWFNRKRFGEFGFKYSNAGLSHIAKYQDSN
jgi:hypothetical protein